ETAAAEQITIKRLQVGFHLHGVNGLQFVFRGALERVDVNFQIVLKQTPEVLENAARQSGIIFFVKQLVNTRHTHDDADAFTRPPGEVRGQPIIFEVMGDDHGHPTRGQHLRACEKIAAVNVFAAGEQIAHGQFHQGQDWFVRHRGFLFKLNQSALEHIEVDVGDRTKTAALDQHSFVMQHVGRLQHLAVRTKHGGAAQSDLHELERHDAVVHVAKLDSAELKHVDLEATRGEVIEQRFDEFLRHVTQEKRAVAKVHAHNAERLLLGRCFFVEHAYVHHNLAG